MAWKTRVFAVLLAGMAASASLCRAETNPLLGRWKLIGSGTVDRDGFNACASIPMLEFTATTQTLYTAPTKFRPAGQSSAAVHYLVSGSKVYVSSTPSFYNAPSYLMVAPGKLVSQDADHCPFQKQ